MGWLETILQDANVKYCVELNYVKKKFETGWTKLQNSEALWKWVKWKKIIENFFLFIFFNRSKEKINETSKSNKPLNASKSRKVWITFYRNGIKNDANEIWEEVDEAEIKIDKKNPKKKTVWKTLYRHGIKSDAYEIWEEVEVDEAHEKE